MSEKKYPIKSLKILLCSLFLIGSSLLLLFFTYYINPTNTSSYHTKLLTQMEQAKSFQEFSDALFCYEVTSDSVTTAYTIKNRDKWDIPNLQPQLTSFSFQKYLEESKSQSPNETQQFITECLSRYSPENMNKEELLSYTLSKKYMDSVSSLSQYPFYEMLLGSSNGVQTNLPVTLGEYPLRSREEIKTYLCLLKQLPAYFDDVISYEKHRKTLSYNTPSFVTKKALDSTKTFVSNLKTEDNCFAVTFKERLSEIPSLSKKEQKKYIKQNATCIEKYILPAYQKLEKYLEENATGDNIDNTRSYGICTLPQGKNYYSALTRHNTGSDKTVEELISLTEQSLNNSLSSVLNVALTNPDAYYHYCDYPLETYYQSPEAILNSLTLMIREDYPVLPNAPSYDIKMVSECLAPSLSPAFYMIPAIDDYQNNTIYINPLFTNDENGNLFPTLAHEGFPGHLYQTVYFNETNPSDLRQILDYLGFVEGWATYVEIDSLSFLDYPFDDSSLCALYQADTLINLALCSRIDMGVNYQGWTLNDTRLYFTKQGFSSAYAEDIYTYVVEAPGNYLSYFVGYLEIMEIKDAYQRLKMEDYNEKEFHQKLLDIGPADFETIREYILK